MLQTTCSSLASKVVSTNKVPIEEVCDGNMIDNSNVDDKANVVSNMGLSTSKTSFFLLETRLDFAKLRQAFSITLILYYFDL